MRHKVVKVVDHEATGAEWRGVREGAGVSLRSLARTMGVSAAYLSDLERGRRNWTEEVESRYAGALRVERQVEGVRGDGQEPPEFDSVGRHWIEGRGLVLVVESDRDGGDFDDLFPHVKVDGEPRSLLALELAAPVRKGDRVGLVVKETAEERRSREGNAEADQGEPGRDGRASGAAGPSPEDPAESV